MTKSDIKFGEISLNQKDNNINNFSKNESLIGKANQEQKQENTDNMIHLENIRIQESNKSENPKLSFENISIDKKEKKHYHINYRKTFLLSFLIIIFTSLTSLGLYFYNKYISNYSIENQTQDNKIIKIIEKVKNFSEQYFNEGHGSASDVNIYGTNGKLNLDQIIKGNTNYIQKKEQITKGLKDLSNLILGNYRNLEDTKKSITKNGFFSNEISSIISEDEQISSIQNSLTSLESIKFSSAINVFPYLDTFLEGLSNTTKLSKTEINNEIDKITSRGEKDINIYIRNCYLNPFEINYNCEVIGDFENYYKLTEDNYFNTSFFKQLIKYTDTKLEQTELPSFSIDFKKFDKNSNKITFNIDINTFKQDEIELAKKGILSPHVFILNNLINNLRQSRFILGEGIVIRTLDIKPKTITIGITEFNINNSNKTFTVDIQKESEREIDDFVEIND